MTITRLICCIGLILSAQSVPAIASEPSRIYQYYLEEGIKAFESHNDEEASRYFAWAREIAPSAPEPSQYLKALTERQRFEREAADSSGTYFPYLKELLAKGKDALGRKDYAAAKQYFYTAHLLNRNDAQTLEYLNLVKRLMEDRVVVVDRSQALTDALDKAQKLKSQSPRPAQAAVSPRPRQVAVETLDQPEEAPAPDQGARPQAYVKQEKKIDVLYLDEILANAQAGRALIKVELWSSVIVEARDIQRFLVVDEMPVAVKRITRDQIQIHAKKMGATFVHIWDASERKTIYVQVVFPPPPANEIVQSQIDTQHARPFHLKYANDWSSYFYGDDVPGMTRRSLGYQQTIGIDGETPYGFLDASGVTIGTDRLTQFVTYTVGLSQIPMPGFKDLDLRFFDATRTLTSLTLPGSSLRGVYADAITFWDLVGLSWTHGQTKTPFGYFSQGGTGLQDSYINAGKFVLFPEDKNKRYAFNYAEGYGNRGSNITDSVYSIEGWQKMGRFALGTEIAKSDGGRAALSGMRWEDGDLRASVNTRQINKEFTTVTGDPSDQGVTGAVFAVDTMVRTAQIGAALDVYQNHLIFNPDDPDGYNYSATSHVSLPLDDDRRVDANVNYLQTPQELGPRRYFSANSRYTQNFNVWGKRKGSYYMGPSYQNSHYAFSPMSEYDRYGAMVGVNLPLTEDLSCNANYEYSWLYEPYSGERYNPNAFGAGVFYNRQLTKKLAGNMGVTYRNEEGLGATNSFLAGQDSVVCSAGLSYRPSNDVTLFMDSRLSSIWAQIPDNPSYNDLDVRLGMRADWGTPFYWDPEGTIEGMAFKDQNDNAKFEKGEEGIPGLKIKIGDKEVVTDDRGWYHLKVRSKKVLVGPVMASVPKGYIFSTPTFANVFVRQGLRDRVDFGLTTRSGIFGVIYIDHNKSGLPDQGDEFIERVKVVVDGKIAQVTDQRGAYFFSNLSAGQHVLALDIQSLPTKYIPLIKLQNEIQVVEGTTYIFHIPMKLKDQQAESK